MPETKWWRATDLPKHFEGERGWMWFEGDMRPTLDYIPREYDRGSKACGGVWLFPLPTPPLPTIESETE
jgi:hypothetical protein